MTLDPDIVISDKNRTPHQINMLKRNSSKRSSNAKVDRAQSAIDDFDADTRRKSYSLASQQRPHSVTDTLNEFILEEATQDAHSSSKL